MRLLLHLLFIVNFSLSSSIDDSLPAYMRGVNWHTVQEHLKTDLSLSGAVVPITYSIDLSLNVRGHAGAQKSDFNGTVHIDLDLYRDIDSIELHSMGLTIEKAELINREILKEPIDVSKISSNSERESITIHANRTINLHEKFMLKIKYRGTAIMDEYGLYENWDPKFNKSADSNGPFVLASKNFPTGARFWFPCFDEPEKKLTIFEKTGSLPPYQMALSVNHYRQDVLDVKGFGRIRLIMSNNTHKYALSRTEAAEGAHIYPYAFDVPGFIKRNLESLTQLNFEIPQEKLGTDAPTVQPGLITIGRRNLISFYYWSTQSNNFLDRGGLAHDFRNITQILIGNRITVKNTNQIWLNDMFSYFLTNETDPLDPLNFLPEQHLHSSLHEKPLRYLMRNPTSTKQFLASRNPLPFLKASQILKLLDRYCPSSKKAVTKYINEHVDGFADLDDFINAMANSCQDPVIASEFLADFIDQPGKALLIVKRVNRTVTITQTRYHSTYFNSQLRDNKTRYTIPIFYKVDDVSQVKVYRKNESSISIDIPLTASFFIENDFDHLYFAYYDYIIELQKNTSESMRIGISNAVRKSMVAALNIGYVNYKQFLEQWKANAKGNLVSSNLRIRWTIEPIVLARIRYAYSYENWENKKPEHCEGKPLPTWDELTNNDEWYWDFKAGFFLSREIQCSSQWHNASTYLRFLEDNFIEPNTSIRPSQMAFLAEKYSDYGQWEELHQFFFKNAGNLTNHRFTMLAETVLNQVKAGSCDEKYPQMSLRDDYVKELRDFVIRNPQRAASMSAEIEMRLEREFVRSRFLAFHNVTEDQLDRDFDAVDNKKLFNN